MSAEATWQPMQEHKGEEDLNYRQQGQEVRIERGGGCSDFSLACTNLSTFFLKLKKKGESKGS